MASKFFNLKPTSGPSMAKITPANKATELILVEDWSSARIIVLNRPKQLNACNFPMISRLLDLFLDSEKDCNVKIIVLKGIGRAFCAGGDVATVVRDISQGNWKLGAHFFRTEFTLNYFIATYSKPQVSILNGIVMGGGAGLSIHGTFRVATENTVFAMPETALGHFPDIGASYFLSRLPGFFGEYAGLTGSRLDGADMLACGLATHLFQQRCSAADIELQMQIPTENCGQASLLKNKTSKLLSLEEALYKATSSDPAIISAIISEFSQVPNLKAKSSYLRLNIINKCFSWRTVEDIISALEREAASSKDDWISSTIQSLKKASPTSLKISLRSIREGRLQGVGKCLVREYRMVCHVTKGEMSKDFIEGCRAILLDKDRKPKWQPSELELVSGDMVDQFFSKVDDEDWEDLELPPRSKLPQHAIAKL